MVDVVVAATNADVVWAQDLRVAYRGYQIHAIYCGNPRIAPDGNQHIWQLADDKGQRSGGWLQSYGEATAAIDGYVEQDAENDNATWYAGCEWATELPTPEGADPDHVSAHEADYVFTNGQTPGSARTAAYAYYAALCKEKGAAGCCYYGKLDSEGYQMDAEEVIERDPAQEHEDREAAYDDYLERNSAQLAWQDRYDAYRAEY